MAIKVITFDLDNTLWDVDPVITRAELAQYNWLQQHRPLACERFSLDQMRDFKNEFHRNHPQYEHQISELRIAALTAMLLSAGYKQAQAESGANEAFSEFMKLRHQVTFYERALETLEILAGQYTLGALTNGNADVSKMDVGDYFDFSYSAEQVNASKPHPAMFEAALSNCNVKAEEAIHVGDNPEHDVIGARQTGMYAIWVNASGSHWPGGTPPHGEINGLKELPAAIESINAELVT